MLWKRKHTPPPPPTHAELRHGSQGWAGSSGDYWVDPRNERVLWAHNPDLPSIPPKLPPFPLPATNRQQRRELPGLHRINRDTLREMYRAAPVDTGNGASGTATSANSVATSSTLSPTANNCLSGFVVTPTAITVSTLGDGTNQYTLGTAANNASGARVTPFYANNVTGTGLTVTATLSGTAANAVIGVREYSGTGSIAGNRSLIDASAQATGNTNAPTASATPQQSGSLYVVGVGDLTGGITYTAGGSVTRRLSVTSPIGLAIGEQVGSSTAVTAIASAWTASGTVQWSEAVIVLRPAATQATLKSSVNAGSSISTLTTTSMAMKLGDTVCAMFYALSSTTSSVADNLAAQTWTKVYAQLDGAGGELSVWTAVITNASTAQMTATFAGPTNATCTAVIPLGVLPNASLVDGAIGTNGNSTSPSITTGTLSIANETVLMFMGTRVNTVATQDGSSALVLADGRSVNGSSMISSRVVASTAPVTMGATIASGNWAAIAIPLRTGGVSFVQSSIGASSGTPSALLTFNSAPGNTIISVVEINNQTGLTGISSPTHTQAITKNNASGGSTDIWYAANIAGGKASNTAATSGGVLKALIAYEIAGLDAVSPLDVKTSNTGNSQSATTGTTGTPNYLHELVVAAAGDIVGGKAYTATSPAAIVQADQTTSIDLAGSLFTMFSPGAAPSGQSTAFAIPGGANVQWTAAVATFKIAGSNAYYQRNLAESGTSADTLGRGAQMSRSVSESASGTDSIGRQYRALRILAETSATADALNRQATLTRTAAESAGATDSLTRRVQIVRALLESSSAGDALSRQYHAMRAMSEGASTTDALARHAALSRVVAELSSAIDNLLGSYRSGPTVAGSVTPIFETATLIEIFETDSAGTAVDSSGTVTELDS